MLFFAIVNNENTKDWKTTSTMSSTVQMILKITNEAGSRYLGERDQEIHNYSLVSRLMH